MAKRPVLRFIYFIATIPYILLSKIAFQFNWWGFKGDVIKCFKVAEKFEQVQLSKQLLETLIVAEDHRNNFHLGIDQVGLCRAIFRTLSGNIQGASTIEQQFVRVAINRYQRTVSRKLLEQLLAVYLSSHLKKEHIATTYLCIAYYGNNKLGTIGLNNTTNLNLELLEYSDAIPIISRLKYPEPVIKNSKWLTKFKNRNKHITEQLNTANKLLKRKNNSWLRLVPRAL